MPDDLALQTMVMDELAWLPEIDAAHIGVSARSGVVTLTGIVTTLNQKLAAERAARRVKGVRGIAQEIVVHPPVAPKLADEEIAERALSILRWDVAVPDRDIQIKIEHGVVTLTGEVAHQFQKQAAERDIARLSGVTRIIDRIDVKSAGETGTEQADIHRKIEDALRRSAELDAAHISVAVSGHKVTLRGRVKSWRESRTAESAAWAASGITEVDNRLTIGT